MKAFVYSLFLLLVLAACTKNKPESEVYIVADHKVDCTGAGPQQCFLLKKQEADDWQYFYNTIEGFDYKEGFEYVIEVKVYDVSNPTADASDKRYVLKQIIRRK